MLALAIVHKRVTHAIQQRIKGVKIHLKPWQDGQCGNFNAPILAVKRLRQLDKTAIFFEWILAFKNNFTVKAAHGDSSRPCMARAGRIFQIDVVCE